MMQPLRVPYALEWPDRTCLAQYPIWTPSTLVTIFTLGMAALRRDIYWTAMILFIWVLNLIISEPCSIFKTIDRVTIETSICLFKNFTEPVSKWTCLDSCRIRLSVSTSTK